jgi:hypothetical protein
MLKAIDVQQVVMQMEQAEKVHRMEQRHPDMQQRYLELQAKEAIKLRQQRVPDAEEAGKAAIRDKKEREGQRDQEKKRQTGVERRGTALPDSQEEEDQDVAPEGGHINIKV